MILSDSGPLQYAVAVNRRGLDEKERTGDAAASTVSFGKLECIHAVTEAIQSLTPHISVDLTNPQVKSVIGYVLEMTTVVCLEPVKSFAMPVGWYEILQSYLCQVLHTGVTVFFKVFCERRDVNLDIKKACV